MFLENADVINFLMYSQFLPMYRCKYILIYFGLFQQSFYHNNNGGPRYGSVSDS